MRNTFKQIGQQEWHAAFILKPRRGTSKTVVEERLKGPPQTLSRARFEQLACGFAGKCSGMLMTWLPGRWITRQSAAIWPTGCLSGESDSYSTQKSAR
jgi:hypothetical protein